MTSFRPDIPYVRHTSYLVSCFLTYCDEVDSFVAVTNLLHSHYFLNLTRGYVAEIKLILTLFDKLFETRMPDLYEHFAFLEIGTAFYLPDWMLSCMISVLTLRVASRVMDCFLLDGVGFMFKACLGLLIYYESELLKSSHF